MNSTNYVGIAKTYIKKPWVIGTIIVVVLIVFFSVRNNTGQAEEQVYIVKSGTVSEGVSVTGKVKAAQAVDLSFERSGKVVVVSKKVGEIVKPGDIIVQIDNREAGADLAQAQAALKFQQSKLAELEESTQPEQIDISKSKVTTAEAELENARASFASALQDSYSDADDAIRNKVDQFFTNPRTTNPQIAFASNVTAETSLESGRVAVEYRLREMKDILPTIKSTADLKTIAKQFKTSLGEIKLFLDNMSLAVNSLTTKETYVSAATVTSWKSDVSLARSSVNNAITSVLSAENKLTSAEGSYDLVSKQLTFDTSGSVVRQIDAQRAQVAQAEANVASAYAQYVKTTIKAPIHGIVTKQEAKLGETISANTLVVSVMSDATFEIEANIPEADIAKVLPGETATITLDAYGPDVVFNARVVAVDPAETMIDGVSTYKTTFQFEGSDGRIKSGMTANVDIEGKKKDGVLYIPQRAITSRSGQKFVNVKIGDTTKEVVIKTGLRGIDGSVEIIEGLNEGDNVVIVKK